MKIECLKKDLTGPVRCSDTEYTFQRDRQGRMVCEIGNPLHINMFLARSDMFVRVEDEAPTAPAPKSRPKPPAQTQQPQQERAPVASQTPAADGDSGADEHADQGAGAGDAGGTADDDDPTASPYAALGRRELFAEAKAAGLKDYARLTNDQIVGLLDQHDAARPAQ